MSEKIVGTNTGEPRRQQSGRGHLGEKGAWIGLDSGLAAQRGSVSLRMEGAGPILAKRPDWPFTIAFTCPRCAMRHHQRWSPGDDVVGVGGGDGVRFLEGSRLPVAKPLWGDASPPPNASIHLYCADGEGGGCHWEGFVQAHLSLTVTLLRPLEWDSIEPLPEAQRASQE